MGHNELLFIASILVSAALVFAAWKLDKERLYSVILIFLILIAISGGKIVEFFGFATNTGNVFYASIFLATYFLIERYGKREGIRSIWIGVAGVVAFSLLLQVILALTSVGETAAVSNLYSAAFASAPRLAFASLLAYIAAQSFNVFFYTFLKKHLEVGHLRRLWLRVNVSNVFAQAIDSVVFFTIAFWGVVAPGDIWEVLLTGFVIKVGFVMLFSPLLYLNRVEEENYRGYASLTLR